MTTVSIKVPDEQFKHLCKMSHYLSLERESDLTLSDLVREALDSTYPMPKDKGNGSQADQS
jgi:hypothetical protein